MNKMKKNSKNDSSNNNNNNNEQVDWEMRPGGMLVQRRDDDNHDRSVPSPGLDLGVLGDERPTLES